MIVDLSLLSWKITEPFECTTPNPELELPYCMMHYPAHGTFS